MGSCFLKEAIPSDPCFEPTQEDVDFIHLAKNTIFDDEIARVQAHAFYDRFCESTIQGEAVNPILCVISMTEIMHYCTTTNETTSTINNIEKVLAELLKIANAEKATYLDEL